jgi:hypothetical protein
VRFAVAVSREWQDAKLMNDTRDLARLRAKYRSYWDAHQLIADQNARQMHTGKQLSIEQSLHERRAAEAVRVAREELRAAIVASQDPQHANESR